jgi:hypothetical protein
LQDTSEINPLLPLFHYVVSALVTYLFCHSVWEEKQVSVALCVQLNKWWTKSLLFLSFEEKQKDKIPVHS